MVPGVRKTDFYDFSGFFLRKNGPEYGITSETTIPGISSETTIPGISSDLGTALDYAVAVGLAWFSQRPRHDICLFDYSASIRSGHGSLDYTARLPTAAH